jgi:hypothetical protein
MLVGAHVGATLGVAALVPARYRSSVDLRLLAICSLLPDAIDKSLYLLGGPRPGHSLAVALVVALVAGPRRPAAWAYAGAVAGHLLLDGLRDGPADRGLKSTSTIVCGSATPGWAGAGDPGTGRVATDDGRRGLQPSVPDFAGGGLPGLLRIYGQVLRGNAEQSLAELIGVALLLSLAHQWRLYRWRVLRALLTTGRIRPTIDLRA